MASAQGDISILMTEAHRPTEPCGPRGRAADLRKAGVGRPAGNRSLFDLALTYFHICGQLREMNRAAEARAAFEAACAAWQKLSESSPEFLRFRVQCGLADCQRNIASILWESGKREEARAALERRCDSEEDGRGISGRHWREAELVRGQRDFGVQLRDAGKPAEAGRAESRRLGHGVDGGERGRSDVVPSAAPTLSTACAAEPRATPPPTTRRRCVRAAVPGESVSGFVEDHLECRIVHLLWCRQGRSVKVDHRGRCTISEPYGLPAGREGGEFVEIHHAEPSQRVGRAVILAPRVIAALMATAGGNPVSILKFTSLGCCFICQA